MYQNSDPTTPSKQEYGQAGLSQAKVSATIFPLQRFCDIENSSDVLQNFELFFSLR